MTTKSVQWRRDTSSDHDSFTGLQGEITVDITQKTLIVHDQTTAGGFPLAREDLSNVDLSNLAQNDLSNVDPAIYTPSDATNSVKGLVELATNSETLTGTDTTRATTPAGVKAALDSLNNRNGFTKMLHQWPCPIPCGRYRPRHQHFSW